MTTKKNMVESLEKALESLDQKPNSRTRKLHRSELSLDINDILSIDTEVDCEELKHSNKSVAPIKVKCCPTVIGIGDFSKKPCSALHCRNCDFPVSSFPNHEWIEQIEYLFLRTNMPNFEKVSEKLKKQNGSIAYACHCVSLSTDKIRHLHEENLPWFCRGHD